MDITAALTPPEIAALSDADRACVNATRELGKPNTLEDTALGVFEESLRMKNTLDAFEEKARKTPSWPTLSVLVNCEYRLYMLNQSTPLRNNPFLSHWVEAIQRLDCASAPRVSLRPHGGPSSSEIHTVRVEFIKALLQSPDPSQFAKMSPRKMYADFVELGQMGEFDVRVYVRMLEEEGIYERTPEPPDVAEQTASAYSNTGAGTSGKTASSYSPEAASGKAREAPRPRLNDFQQWKQDMLDKLQHSPNTAIPELTHLPIELSYLDFLTTLLQEKTLESFAIESPPIISDYIQHALRLTEKMGLPPDASTSATLSGTNEEAEGVLNRGREAQTRAVKLLLLFIRNMIRKALVPLEAIYFEIQEICVRYVWIREVREFRAFIEEGAGGEVVDG
ncbi:hypothetical protein K458DRAFT_291239 [Lentithecium fluviatile CBS 122367]|uniref:Uncharacterized protein n=1 Tax=Lentithecium fluviatile CBS 122367 TaxID=1168545 RepID=A0A6G1JF26_9PLEO|nr:hypothetical protein K458DRAFT_291239 [Lentithecium fluviatile CBS 122367]